MKTQSHQIKRPWFVASLAALGVLGTYSSSFALKKGPISQQEVKSYFIDWWTHDCEKGDACTVTFDSPVKIAPATRHTFQIPPATYLCYPVKVNFTTHWNRGTFHLTHYTHAVYYFYRNSFDEWEMGKEGERTTQEKDAHQTPKQSTPPKEPTVNNPTAADPARGISGPPKPDFSEMEDSFEIVKYEYPKPPDNVMWIYFKPKVDLNSRPTFFYIQFRDKDGVLVGAQNQNGNGIMTKDLAYTETGTVGKTSVYIPSEKEMENVVSAKVVRIKQ